MDKVFREPPSGDLHPMTLEGPGLRPITHLNKYYQVWTLLGGNSVSSGINVNFSDTKALSGPSVRYYVTWLPGFSAISLNL